MSAIKPWWSPNGNTILQYEACIAGFDTVQFRAPTNGYFHYLQSDS